MTTIEIIGGVLLLLACIGITILVLMQESPKSGGLSALTGADSFLNKNQGRTRDAVLSKSTKILAVVFFVVTIVVYTITSRMV